MSILRVLGQTPDVEADFQVVPGTDKFNFGFSQIKTEKKLCARDTSSIFSNSLKNPRSSKEMLCTGSSGNMGSGSAYLYMAAGLMPCSGDFDCLMTSSALFTSYYHPGLH